MFRTRVIVAVVTVAALAAAFAITRSGAAPEPVIAAQGAAPARPPGATLEVTYIANEGVLLAAGTTQVLIDGLHRQYRPSYPFLPEPYREQIERAQAPFNEIDVVLVSHVHLDHFHPESVARHLQHNPRTRLIAPEQVVAEIQARGDFEAIRPRLNAMTPALKHSVVAGGLTSDLQITVLGIGRGAGRNASLQNLGYLVRLGDRTALHIGDASTEDASIFEAFNLDDAQIDVAFLPVWFLTSDEGAAIVQQHITPKQIVAVHMAAGEPRSADAQIRKRFPDAAAFTVLLDKKFY